MNEITTSEATVGLFWAGTIPYYTERRGIDFLGKVDSYIAHLPPDMSGACSCCGMNSSPGHNKYDLNYSIKLLRPTYVQALKWCSQDISAWAENIYVKVEYKGVSLWLLRGAPTVRWDLLSGNR